MSFAMTRAEREAFLAETRVGILGVVEPRRGPLTPDFERDIRAMAIRYLGPEMGEMYLAMTADDRAREPSVLVEMRPVRWRSVDYRKMIG